MHVLEITCSIRRVSKEQHSADTNTNATAVAPMHETARTDTANTPDAYFLSEDLCNDPALPRKLLSIARQNTSEVGVGAQTVCPKRQNKLLTPKVLTRTSAHHFPAEALAR